MKSIMTLSGTELEEVVGYFIIALPQVWDATQILLGGQYKSNFRIYSSRTISLNLVVFIC